MKSRGWQRAKAMRCHGGAQTLARYLKRERSQRERRQTRQVLRADPERAERAQRPSGDDWRLS